MPANIAWKKRKSVGSAGRKPSAEMSRFVTLTLVCLLAACSTPQREIPQPVSEAEALIMATSPALPYLNVSIAVFKNQNADSGKSGAGRISRIYAPIHEAEANYLPVVLRNSLIESGHWGAVRVGPDIPSMEVAAELHVDVTILTSTALDLALSVKVVDSRGITWLDNRYTEQAQAATYAMDERQRQDPFQPLFNRIANDLFRARQALSPADATWIVRASLLRYANALAPEAFGHYLSKNADGVIKVTGLPALDDPMYLRVRKIREAEYRFTDLMDEHFNGFYTKLQSVYPYWQTYSYELLAYNNQIKATGTVSSRRQSGAWDATQDIYHTYKEFKMNEDELRELADSFKAEIHPTISMLEGSVIELQGPLENQYAQWRRILREIYAKER